VDFVKWKEAKRCKQDKKGASAPENIQVQLQDIASRKKNHENYYTQFNSIQLNILNSELLPKTKS
jgi:hypothetical protein